MSPHKGMFTDLVKSKLEIHVANDSIIYSTMVGIFHLPTILSDGSQITLHLKNSLYVPSLVEGERGVLTHPPPPAKSLAPPPARNNNHTYLLQQILN